MPTDDLTDDILNGAAEIAGYIKQPVKNTYVLLESGKLPGFKWGGKNAKTWHARKSALLQHVERLEGGAS